MANTVPFFRMYLKEPARKALGINLKNKKIYLFKVQNKVYLSTNVIPKSGKYKIIRAKLGMYSWIIDIPIDYVGYTPTNYKVLNTRGKVLELISSEK